MIHSPFNIVNLVSVIVVILIRVKYIVPNYWVKRAMIKVTKFSRYEISKIKVLAIPCKKQNERECDRAGREGKRVILLYYETLWFSCITVNR